MSAVPKPEISKEQQEVAELVRSGAYFDEARAWYQALFIGPISERTFFLIIAILAGLVGIAGIVAVVSLLPITERPAVMVANARLDETALDLIRMRKQYEPVNPAMRKFYIKQYIERRESYDAVRYPKHYAFIHAHSDDPTFAAYSDTYNPENPQSFLNVLGERGRRWADVRSVEVNEAVEPKVATVRFSTETLVNEMSTITQWTAVIGFYYSDLAVTPVVDPATGELSTQTQEPVFQVVSYVLAPANTADSAQ